MKMNNSLLYIFLALAAGLMIPFQSAMNAQLGKALMNPYYAALTVFLVAAVGISIYIAVAGYPLPNSTQLAKVPVWSYAGGLLGGAYILLVVLCAPKLGIGNVTVLVLLGQLISAIVIDHFGMLQTPLHAINWQRIVGALLVAGGVYLVKKN